MLLHFGDECVSGHISNLDTEVRLALNCILYTGHGHVAYTASHMYNICVRVT